MATTFVAGQLTEEGTSKTVQALGMTIHYHDIGTGDPIILLHSYGPGSTAWITFFKNFPELSKHYRCIAMDLPNFAKTGPAIYDEPIHSFQAKTALALMDALGIEKAHIVGNSQGGQTAMVFAYKYPDRINKLVWGGGHIGVGPGGSEYVLSNRREEGIRLAREAGQDPTKENLRRYLLGHINDEALVTDELVDYIHKMYTGRPDLAEARSKSRGVSYNHRQYIVNIKAPTLMIWGRYDRVCQFEIGINALNHIPNSRLVVINDTGHWTPFERPEEYNSHVLNFLKGDWA